jgi:hypothetical protein
MVLCYLNWWTCFHWISRWWKSAKSRIIRQFSVGAPAIRRVVVTQIELWLGRVGRDRDGFCAARSSALTKPNCPPANLRALGNREVRRILMKMLDSWRSFGSCLTCRPIFNRKFMFGCRVWLISGHYDPRAGSIRPSLNDFSITGHINDVIALYLHFLQL